MELINNKLKEFFKKNKYLTEKDLEIFMTNNREYFNDSELIF